MKKILFTLLVGFMTSSCASTYFYSTMASSSKDVKQIENGDFHVDQDSIWINYSFRGEGSPINITIFNKTQSPLYVDWSKSTLIIGEEAIAYPKNKIDIEGKVDGTGDAILLGSHRDPIIISSYSGTYKGQADLPSHISFIPPQTKINESSDQLRLVDLTKIPKSSYSQVNMVDTKGEILEVDKIDFSEDSTPLKFRCYLSLYAQDANDKSKDKHIPIEHDFYLKNVIKSTSISPYKMDKELLARGDFSYIEKPGNNKGWKIAGKSISAGAIGLDAIWKVNHRDDRDGYRY